MRAMANRLDRLQRELHAAATARPRDAARYAAALEQAVQACRSDPSAAELFDLAELHLELSTGRKYKKYCAAPSSVELT
jgi:hypothetical protein